MRSVSPPHFNMFAVESLEFPRRSNDHPKVSKGRKMDATAIEAPDS